MQFQFFRIPAASPESLTEELNRFVRGHRILSVQRELVQEAGSVYWAVCVEYLPAAPGSDTHTAQSSGAGKPKVDYKEVLSEADFSVFSRLRQLRKEVAEREGLPVYAVLLKPWQLNRVERGLPFLGCQLFPHRLRLDRRGRQRFAAKLRQMEWEYAVGRLGALELQQRAMALAAHTETCEARGFRRAVLAARNFGAAVMDAASGTNRVLRGGNWNNNANNCRVSNRNNNNPTNSNNNTGFRCVRSSETSPGMGNNSDPAAVLSVARKKSTARRQKPSARPGQVARADAASKVPDGIFSAVCGLVAFCIMAVSPAHGVVVNDNDTLAEASALASDFADYPAFASVGTVQVQEGASSYLGTGILIAPDWVLTAAHNWDTGAVTSLSFDIGGATYAAQSGQWFQDPQWVADPNVSLTQGSDIALFHLTQAVPGAAPVTLYSGSNELGATVTVLGSGLAGTAATGPRSNPTSTLYAIHNTIDRVITLSGSSGGGGLLAFDFDDGTSAHNSLAGSAVYDTLGHAVTSIPNGTIAAQSSTATVMPLEGTTAAGDSGGPAFAGFGSGLELIGLTSWGVNPTNPSNLYGSGYGDITYLTEVSAADGWITATIPEPTVSCLVIFGVVILVFCRSCIRQTDVCTTPGTPPWRFATAPDRLNPPASSPRPRRNRRRAREV